MRIRHQYQHILDARGKFTRLTNANGFLQAIMAAYRFICAIWRRSWRQLPEKVLNVVQRGTILMRYPAVRHGVVLHIDEPVAARALRLRGAGPTFL